MDSGSEHRSANGGRGGRPDDEKRRGPIERGRRGGPGRLLPAAATAPPPQRSKRNGRPRLRKLRIALVILGLSLLALVSWIFGIMMAVAQDLPSLENREQYKRSENSVVWDINGERIATLTNNQGRILISSDEISPVVKEAVVAIEDQRFYEHRGVDFQGIARAVWQDVTSGSTAQGASTITQQFVKNALAAQGSRTVFQKLREAALAYHLERQWSKDKILSEYLNEIYFGEGATGIEAAARTYFGYNHPGCGADETADTCASQLLPWEAALLAGMISSPAGYSPRNLPEQAKARRDQVLQNMASEGYITEEEYAQYVREPIPKPDQIAAPAENSQAPYFTSWLRQQLVDRYGVGEAFGGGLQITSTLDLDLQRQVESIVRTRLAGIEPTASVVVLDNDTAAVRAMVGGPDFADAPFNLATNGHRQPGSAFKPFTLITALEQGHSTAEVYPSAPQEIPFRARFHNRAGKQKTVPELFKVHNYEDSYLGSASIASATTYSDNSVYSQLGTQAGPQNVADTARRMGIETDLSTSTRYSIDGGPFEPYNPALILGGLETGVTPLEMAHAYNTLAADGTRLSGTMAADPGGPVGIYDVRDGDTYEDGDLVPDATGASGKNEIVAKQVLDPGIAQTAKDVLSTVVSSGTGTNAQTTDPTWGKTGTTDDNGDAWFCGATDEITVCVWVGHADSVTPMETEYAGAPVDGGTFPALIFSDVVAAYDSVAPELKADRKSGDDAETTTASEAGAAPAPAPETAAAPAPETTPAPVPGTTVPETDGSSAVAPSEPAVPAQPIEPAAPAPSESTAPAPSAPAPSSGGSGGAPAPTGGGVSPG